MRVVKVDAVGGSIWRVLDEQDHRVAEFYREGDAESFVLRRSSMAAMHKMVVVRDALIEAAQVAVYRLVSTSRENAFDWARETARDLGKAIDDAQVGSR